MGKSGSQGYSLIEFIAIIVIVGALTAVVVGRFTGTTAVQLQAGRDSVVSALLAAQQLAMAQAGQVQVELSGSQIDVRQDTGSGFASIQMGGTIYPLDVSPVTISTHTLDFSRLGRTTATSVNLGLNGSSTTITVSASGFSQ
jgi:type II secretory pathway pseudopilin PulG